MKNKILLINDLIIMVICVSVSILGAKLFNSTNNITSIQTDENYFLQAYPIGSIYITTNIEENTAEKMKELHGGNWEIYGDGRLLQSNSKVDAGTTGGSNEVVLQVDNLPSHNHNIPSLSVSNTTINLGGKWTMIFFSGSVGGPGGHSLMYPDGDYSADYINRFPEGSIDISGQTTAPSVTDGTGSGTAFNVQNEYITVYMWKRVE